jgi:N-acetylmuramate 1-kinase
MVVDEELVWLDFQDALLGPRVYDLVALLHDSYQDLGDEFVRACLAEYGEQATLATPERESLEREFDRVTIQRKLKDAGRFVFIDRVKHNPAFLPYVKPTLHKVARTLDRLSAAGDADMGDLRALLRSVLPEEFGA